MPAELLHELGERLEPGGAIAAVLVDHVWRRTLEDAVSRTGGRPLVTEYVDVTKLAELMPQLLAARP